MLEALIALIIAGAGLTVLLRSGASALTATRTATRYEEAVARARSHLAATLHGAPLAARENRGDDGGGFFWRERIAAGGAVSSKPGAAPMTLYEVSVAISWHDGGAQRDVQLTTQQVGAGAR